MTCTVQIEDIKYEHLDPVVFVDKFDAVHACVLWKCGLNPSFCDILPILVHYINPIRTYIICCAMFYNLYP